MAARWGGAIGACKRSCLLFAAALACGLIAPAAASAGAGIGYTPTFPQEVTVGQRGVAASIHLSNDSDAFEGSMTVCALGDCPELGPSGAGSIMLTPSCGVFDPSVSCPPAGADPGVFSITSTPTGRAGSACAGQLFDITTADTNTGTLRLEPRTGRVVLGPNGAPNDACDIDFTVAVLKLPTMDSFPGRPGVQTSQYGSVAGRTSIRGLLGLGRGSSVTTVNAPAPPPSPPQAGRIRPPGPPPTSAQVRRGSARLSAPTGCPPTPFHATVRGFRISRVRFFLDGDTIAVLRRPNRRGAYSVRINPRRLSVGRHRIVAKVTFTRGSRTRPRRLTVVFQRCARRGAAVRPRFTG